jgi:hypothetical protein
MHLVGQRDQTIVGWIDPSGRVIVSAYGQRSNARAAAVLAQLPVDDHSNPSLLVEPDHRITAFYSGHNGNQMYYRTTRRPEDVSAWSSPKVVAGNLAGDKRCTYPNPEILSAEGNMLYLLWRGGNWNLVYDYRSGHGGGWVYDVALDNHDRPVIVYETVRSPQHHLYWYARWTG